MAIFVNNDKSTAGNSGNTSIIAEGTIVKGDIVSECNVHVDGTFDGNIVAKNTVAIGRTGIMIGDIDATHLIVSGHVKGSCNCQIVEVLPQGRIDGEVSACEIVIEKTAEIVGNCRVNSENVYKSTYEEKYAAVSKTKIASHKPVSQEDKPAE